MIGQKLGNRYEIVRELGRGGMGVVYLAHDVLLDRDVAVKRIGAAQLPEEARSRFLREARVIAKMDHPGIVSVYDIGLDGDALFLVMAFVPGSNLREVLEREGRLQPSEVVDLGIQAAEALEHAHSIGIVHRDIKPENIMIVRKEGATRVLLADFGLATALSEQRLTHPGTVLGTVAYMSPEQVEAKPMDGRGDIYALGTVLFECAAGDVPFPGIELASVLYRIVHQAPPALRRLAPAVDAELEAVIMRCLQKDPSFRIQRPRDLAEALRRCAQSASAARAAASPVVFQLQPTVLAPASDVPRRTVTQRRLAPLWIGAGAIVVAAGGLASVPWLRRASHAARAKATASEVGAPSASSTPAAPAPVAPVSSPASSPATAPVSCERYCDLVLKNCTGANAEYLSRDICMKMCPAFEIGVGAGDTADGTLGCRLYHAGAAEGSPGEHCRAAGPLGGRQCGKDPCEPFCALAVTYCVPPKPPPYADGLTECRAACKSYPYVADAGDTALQSGNTLNCRLWHLQTAYTSDGFGLFHCPHTKRVSSTCY